MLSVFVDALVRHNTNRLWDAPDHFKVRRHPRSNIARERDAAEQRHRAMRDAGLW